VPTTPRPVAVLDIDGVLADVRHRLRYVERSPKDWDAFFSGIPADPPLEVGLALAAQLSADHDIAYLTGRPERTRTTTSAWLVRHGLPPGELLMRRDTDRRPARVAKVELLRQISAGATVAVVVDDDPAVCAAVRAAGWPVLAADWSPRPETLNREQERGRT
jgi:hypothetical protein